MLTDEGGEGFHDSGLIRRAVSHQSFEGIDFPPQLLGAVPPSTWGERSRHP